MIQGQINLGDDAGNLIHDISKRDDVYNIVELGTWNGMGSTLCIIKALIESNKKKNFISIELYKNMYEIAMSNLKNYGFIEYVNLLNGRIIDYEDVFWFDHNQIDFSKDDHARLWYAQDMENLKNMENVIDQLPKSIDFLILDGGEYTTYPEWIKLKDRTRIVALDDSTILKCSRIRKEILESGQYDVIYDNLELRNGFSLFQKK
jgi:hypothetical protein